MTPSPISRRLRMTSLCVSFMKYLLTCLLASALLVSATMFAAQSRQTFSGTITDNECPGADHSGMRMGSTDAALHHRLRPRPRRPVRFV